MAGYWPSSLFAFLWTEAKSKSIKTQEENEANTQVQPKNEVKLLIKYGSMM